MLIGTPIFKYNPERPFRDEPDLYLQFWGKEKCAPGHAVGPGVKEVYKIHFIHQGKGLVRIGEREYTLSAGQAFLIYPHYLTYYEADREEPWVYSWVGFYGAQALPILARTGLTPEMPVFPMDMQLMPGLYEKLTDIQSDEISCGLRLQAALYELMSSIMGAIPLEAREDYRPTKQDTYVHQSMEFIHSHYGEDLSVQQLASALGLDRKYLSVIFKNALGVPPQQYLLQYRMDKARELLGKGKYTVGEVARSVGYPDALQFSKMFKKISGVSPKNFKPF
ncbi:AraC family transcriptional regulator [Cohnella mopanensis]|uniref:AraC family transcriptional regulator n=1 Tax=Cohnella mopanensis TaxID=2911966 RepID=UPI001EF98BAF|nr:AraC family transcriptional regulator [Cohnella mopanensis]